MVVEDGKPFSDNNPDSSGDVSITSNEDQQSQPENNKVIQIDTNELLNLAVTSVVGGMLATMAKSKVEEDG